MIPINDSEPNRYGTLPLMTIGLIAVNTAILVWEMFLPISTREVVFRFFGSTPSYVWTGQGAGMLATITSMFLHGDPIHLISNMPFLWVFGRRVEDACGPLRFLVFYLLAGTTSDLMTALATPHSIVPGIGASGAIFGVMGAYLILFPGGRIRTLWFISIIPTWPRIRAFWFVLYYVIVQIGPAYSSLASGRQYGIGYWAHLGGFFACILIPLFMKPEAFARYMSNVPV